MTEPRTARLRPLASALLALSLLPAAVRASTIAADVDGRPILQRALAALGGIERIDSRAQWIVEGRGRENLGAENQGLDPDAPTWRPHEERIAVDAAALAVAWERRTPRNDESLRWRRFIWRADSSGVFDWSVARGAMRAATNPDERRRAIARRVPHLLLAEAARHATRVTSLGARAVDGATCDAILVELPDAPAALELAIGRDPAVVREVGYLTRIPGFGETRIAWRWSGWARDDALGLVPAGHAVMVGETPFQEIAYTRYAAPAAGAPGATEAAELLAQPRRGGGHADAGANSSGTPAPRVLQAAALPAMGEVASGVHVFDARGFTVGWIELRDFVVAFEAPETSPGLEAIPAASDTTRRTRMLLDEIARVSPGKPVRYAVISHHHGDHMGGAAEYARAGTTLLVAPAHRTAAERALARATGKPVGEVVAVAGKHVIEDGARRVEVIDVGPSPHTGANLCLWVPDAGVLFQGDLFYFQAGAPFPPSGRGTMNRFFARWLSAQGIRPRAIYGVHDDEPAGPDALEAALALPEAANAPPAPGAQ